jgi:hypothetical protein
MRRILAAAASGAMVTLLVLYASEQRASAKPEYTRRTSKDCAFCHQPPGYNLNEAGKYYVDHSHSLKGYTPPPKPQK